jgi:hypothetical protein
MQAQLQQYATSSQLIYQMLGTVIAQAAGVARVRLAVIHNGVSGVTGISSCVTTLSTRLRHPAGPPARWSSISRCQRGANFYRRCSPASARWWWRRMSTI